MPHDVQEVEKSKDAEGAVMLKPASPVKVFDDSEKITLRRISSAPQPQQKKDIEDEKEEEIVVLRRVQSPQQDQNQQPLQSRNSLRRRRADAVFVNIPTPDAVLENNKMGPTPSSPQFNNQAQPTVEEQPDAAAVSFLKKRKSKQQHQDNLMLAPEDEATIEEILADLEDLDVNSDDDEQSFETPRVNKRSHQGEVVQLSQQVQTLHKQQSDIEQVLLQKSIPRKRRKLETKFNTITKKRFEIKVVGNVQRTTLESLSASKSNVAKKASKMFTVRV